MPHSHLVVYQRNVPPIDRTMVRCAVCGQYNDADKTMQPDGAAGVQRVTGTVYFAKRPGGEINFAAIDKTVETVVPGFQGCWFCGSPRIFDGAAGPLGR